jgi:hypothetical protein
MLKRCPEVTTVLDFQLTKKNKIFKRVILVHQKAYLTKQAIGSIVCEKK